ncbi:MAG: iron ABC transporter permease [Proteobacteria bacterium]|nr:iron ABC transporter permease [Pseudomonadota bacterium]
MNKKIIRWILWIVMLGGILLCTSVFSLCVGSANVSFKAMFASIFNSRDSAEYSILFNIRLPRIILGFSVGGALALSGVMLQGMFRNPLVEPYTLGISGGAALGVALNIVLRLNNTLGVVSLPVSGFFGAILVVLLVYSVSLRKEGLRIQGILLTGVMLSFISSSLIMLIMSVSSMEDLQGIVFWIMGSLEEPNWLLIQVVLWVSVSGLVISYLFCLDLNALSLGDEEAQHLGIKVESTKRLLFILSSLLTGLSVSVSGVIGFVGLVVPHFMRMFVGNDHRILLVSSFLCGAVFLILCDTLARTIIAPMELPVGVITGVLGGTIFVYTLTRKQIT